MDKKNNFQVLNENDLEMVTGGFNGPCFVYVVEKGDCLSALAQRYGTTVRDLVKMNNIKNPDQLYEGLKLLIPYTTSQS